MGRPGPHPGWLEGQGQGVRGLLRVGQLQHYGRQGPMQQVGVKGSQGHMSARASGLSWPLVIRGALGKSLKLSELSYRL